jgi:hypothetical protein
MPDESLAFLFGKAYSCRKNVMENRHGFILLLYFVAFFLAYFLVFMHVAPECYSTFIHEVIFQELAIMSVIPPGEW